MQGHETYGELWEYPEATSSEEVQEDDGVEDDEAEGVSPPVPVEESLKTGSRARGPHEALLKNAPKLKRRKSVR